EALDVAAQAFADLAKELEMEEASAVETQEMGDEEEEDQPLDNWVDYCEGLNEEECKDLDASIQPVWLMLIKLCKMAFTLKNSMMLLLPKWYDMLATHHLPHHMMPHDVSTRWNSTFDMLKFAIEYHPTIDTMTTTRDFDL
ncbi:hypothetical protein EI94DRAFT_1437269, partial [Lactarius quietus]